jgi:hypothetical protein
MGVKEPSRPRTVWGTSKASTQIVAEQSAIRVRTPIEEVGIELSWGRAFEFADVCDGQSGPQE